MIIRHDAQLPPTIHHSQQTKVIVLDPLASSRFLAQRKLIQQIILQQQFMSLATISIAKDRLSRTLNAIPQLLLMTSQHQLEQISDRLSILLNLSLGSWVQDSQTSINMPLVRIDAQRDVDLDILNPTHIPRHLPRKLIVRRPRSAHGQESRMRHRLRISCNAIMSFGSQLDMLALKARQDFRDKIVARVRGAVLDQHQGLAFGVYTWSVEGVARDDFDV